MRFTEHEKLLLSMAAQRIEELSLDVEKLGTGDPIYDYGSQNLIRDLRKLAVEP